VSEDIIPDGEAKCENCGTKHSYFPCDKEPLKLSEEQKLEIASEKTADILKDCKSK